MKQYLNREIVGRVLLTLFILLFGVAMVPYVDLPASALNWELFAGIYTPTLEVGEDQGGPGSVFAFTGTNYPPNSLASVYVNGRSVGSVTTDATGSSTFLVDATCAVPGLYNVTMEVDINASATQTYEVVAGAPVVQAPPQPGLPTFAAGQCLYLPAVVQP